MGHKTHPLGFRLGITQQHYSSWYSKLNIYSDLIHEDFKIRKTIHEYLELKGLVHELNKILILRINKKQTNISIETSSPGAIVGPGGKGLLELDKQVQNVLKNSKFIIYLKEIENTHVEANMVGDMLVQELLKQTPFRRAMKLIIKAVSPNVQGVKIQISGRLNGAEIARTEWLKEGRVPLQTLRAQIDYAEKIAPTKYGILGIKIWLFKGEILNIKKLGL